MASTLGIVVDSGSVVSVIDDFPFLPAMEEISGNPCVFRAGLSGLSVAVDTVSSFSSRPLMSH